MHEIHRNLCDGSTLPPVGLEAESKKLHKLLRDSLVSKRENATILLMGPRGHGKRLLLDTVLSEVLRESKEIRVVRLNGLQLHGGDDSVAVREIMRQMSSSTRSFTTGISTFSDMIEHAQIDAKPIVLILHEMEYFAGCKSNSKQILLYHILDRASDHKSKLTVIGTTSKMSAVSMFEKRVKSRAMGNQTILRLGHYSYQTLSEIIASKFAPHPPLQRHVSSIFQSNPSLLRNYNLGKSVRWFCRVFHTALSLSPDLHQTHLDRALECNGGGNTSLRTVRLRDLSAPQVTLLLCARRIVLRRSNSVEERAAPPLTFERMLQEYDDLAMRHSSVSYSPHLLRQSFLHLMECDLVKNVSDHAGSGALSYNLEAVGEGKMGVEILLDFERELDVELRAGRLDCPTGVRDWGLKIN